MMRHSSTEEKKNEKKTYMAVCPMVDPLLERSTFKIKEEPRMYYIFSFFLKKIIYNININIGNTALWLEPRDILGPFFMIIVIKTIGHVRKKNLKKKAKVVHQPRENGGARGNQTQYDTTLSPAAPFPARCNNSVKWLHARLYIGS